VVKESENEGIGMGAGMPTWAVFLVMTKNALEPVKRDHSVNTFKNFSLSHAGVSEVSEQAREWIERAKLA